METIITLLKDYTDGLLDAQSNFLEHLGDFPELEEAVVELSNKMAAGFLGACLTAADELIRDSGSRLDKFEVQRTRTRTLVSSVGDITFEHTLYKDQEGHTRRLLDELIGLPDKERFTTQAETKLLRAAIETSYQKAAMSIRSASQTITKTTVMNKVHAIERELPDIEPLPEEKKQVRHLYIEADEDHIHRQKNSRKNGCFIGKLIYLFEGKETVGKGRRILISPHYFGGIYNGSDNNAILWQTVERYIQDHYDQDYLRCVYISGDGGVWIKTATEYVYKSCFILDRFHLSQYIHRVAACTLADCDITTERLYKYIYKDNMLATKKLLTRIQNHCDNSDKAVESCRSLLFNNWEAIQRAFHDKHVLGCSAEGHVSHIYSDRMSSRPMAWSEKGAHNLCKMKCFVSNYSRDKVIDLVRWRRQREREALAATGTDGPELHQIKRYCTAQQRKTQDYYEWLQVSFLPNSTARKSAAIRNQIRFL